MTPDEPNHAPLARDAGVVVAPQLRDPYAALDDLMMVVEALCPTWPDRRIPTDWGVYRL